MLGKVCEKSVNHGYAEDGICKWCDPPLASGFDPTETISHWTSGPPMVHLISSEIGLSPDFAAKMRAAFNGSGFRGFKGIPPSEHEADEDPK